MILVFFGIRKAFFELINGLVRQPEGAIHLSHAHGDIVGIGIASLRLFDDGERFLIGSLIAVLLKDFYVRIAGFVQLSDAFVTRGNEQ